MTALLAALATIATPLVGTGWAATALGAPTASPSGTDAETRPTVSFAYAAAMDQNASTISIVDTSASNAPVPCTVSFTNSAKTILCAVTTDLVDNHNYTATANVLNAADSTDHRTTDATSWTTDIPSKVKQSPGEGSINAAVKSFSVSFDEPISTSGGDPNTSNITVDLINGAGHHVQGSGHTSGSNNSNPPSFSPPVLGVATWTSDVGGLAPGNYTATFKVFADTNYPTSQTFANTADWGTATIHFTVDTSLPADAPQDVTAPSLITQQNQAAVPFHGFAPVGSNVAVAIYDETYDADDPLGPDTEGSGPKDGFGTTVTPDCTNAQSELSANDVKMCPFTVLVDDSASPDSGTTQTDPGGGPPPTYTEKLQWYAFTFTAAGQKPEHACPTTSTDCPGPNPVITKDATGPKDTPSGANAKWNKVPNTVTVQGATDTNTDSQLDHYVIQITDPENHLVTATSAKGAALSGYQMTPTDVDVSSLDDGLLTVKVFAADNHENLSGADTASVTSATPPASNTLTKEAIPTAPAADTSVDTLVTSGATKHFDQLTPTTHIHTPTSVTVYFNELIKLVVTDSSGANSGSPVTTFKSEICLDDSTGPGSCLNHGVGTTALTPDGKGLIWTAPANYQLPSDVYDVSAIAASKNNCPDKTNTNSSGYTCEHSVVPGDALTNFVIDETPPAVSFTSVPAVDANNVNAVPITGKADGDTTQVVLSIHSSGGGATRLVVVNTTPNSNGAGTINWSTSPDLTGLPDGLLTLTAVAQDGAGNTTAQANQAVATTPMQARPSAPQNFSAAAGNGQVVVFWVAPATNGGHPLTGYTLTVTDTSVPGSTPTVIPIPPSATNYTVNGLSNGHTYSLALTAANDIGNGPAATKSVTPKGNTTMSAAGALHGVITYGQSFTLHGTLAYFGVGLGGEHVTITSRYYNGTRGPSYSATTDPNGNWSVRNLKPGKNITYVASFAGDSAYNGSSRAVGVAVRAAIHVTSVSAASSSHSSPVTLRGTVAPNLHGYRVYIYEVRSGTLVKIGTALLSSRSVWVFTHTFSRGTHLVVVKIFAHAGNAGNQTGRVKIVRS